MLGNLLFIAWISCCFAGDEEVTSSSNSDSSSSSSGYCDLEGLCTGAQFDLRLNNSGENYNTIGIELDEKKQQDKALEAFRAASFFSSHQSYVWLNVGESLVDNSNNESYGYTQEQRLELLREALAAYDVVALIDANEDSSGEGRTAVIELLNSEFEGRCHGPTEDCDLYNKEVTAMDLLHQDRYIESVNLLCHPEHMTVEISQTERKQGVLNAHTVRRVLLLMRICGVCHLKDIYDVNLLSKVHDYALGNFHNFYDHKSQRIQPGQKHEEWPDAAFRSEGRYEVKFDLKYPVTHPDFVANRFMLPLAKAILAHDAIEIDTFSQVASLPNAPDMAWHSDVDFLFDKTVVGSSCYLPAQGIVVIIPLVNLTKEVGPTEFMTGSHTNMFGADYWSDHEKTPVTPVVSLETNTGSAVIFDVRNYHRGIANKSNKVRPIVYMSYVQDWWFDKVNFKDPQTNKLDSLEGSMRKLLRRQDSRRYVQLLEAKIKELDPTFDFEAIQPSSDYEIADLVA